MRHNNFNKLAALRSYVEYNEPGKNKRQYAEAIANPEVMNIIIVRIEVSHSDLSKVINWLRENINWDGRAPAGFDTKKRSWGSSDRANFWADGSKVVIQGSKRAGNTTKLTMYFSPDIADIAMLFKLTMA